MNKNTSGFTIVELLIVIVVIAILAAISIVAYTGIQNSANDSAVQSDLRNFAMKIQEYQILNGSYPASGVNNGSMPGGITIAASQNSYHDGVNLYYCVVAGTSDDRFSVVARSKSGNIYAYYNGGFQTYGSTTFSSGLSICPQTGMTTSEQGFEYHYGRGSNGAWSLWTNG